MVVSFFRGHPTESLLPSQLILRAAENVLGVHHQEYNKEENRHPLTYGTDSGALYVRQALVEWTNRTLQGTGSPEMINLTNGASFGLASALLQLTSREYTRRAFVVSPTYFLLNQMLIDHGFKDRMSAVVETETGLDLDGLEKALQSDIDSLTDSDKKLERVLREKYAHQGATKFRYVMYLVPSFSNPGGFTLPLDQRKLLISLAHKYNMLVLCDEVYEWLDFHGGHRPPLLVTIDRQLGNQGDKNWVGNVVANYSISKILGPGLRVGWQETATKELAAQLCRTGANKSGGTPAQLNTYIVAETVKNGWLDEEIAKLNQVYGERAKTYLEAMNRFFPKGTHIRGGDGGYFFWVTLPKGFDLESITKECAQDGIILAPGSHFEVDGDSKGWGERCFRFALCYLESHVAVEAIERIGGVIGRSSVIERSQV